MQLGPSINKTAPFQLTPHKQTPYMQTPYEPRCYSQTYLTAGPTGVAVPSPAGRGYWTVARILANQTDLDPAVLHATG